MDRNPGQPLRAIYQYRSNRGGTNGIGISPISSRRRSVRGGIGIDLKNWVKKDANGEVSCGRRRGKPF